MKYFKLFVAFLIVAIAISSCSKEGNVSTEDIIPEIEVVEETIESGELEIGNRSFGLDTSFFVQFIDDNSEVINYQLGLYSYDFGQSVSWGSILFRPEEGVTEAGIQERTYVDPIGSANWITDEGIALFEAWKTAGSDPNAMPDIFAHMVNYDIPDLELTVSNLTDDSLDASFSGNMVDDNGVSTPVSGSFTAKRI